MVTTRKRIIQSNDEYMLEQETRNESPQENVAASEVHTSAGGDQIDSEVNFQDETEGRKKRGRTKLKDIWNLPKGRRIVVACNELDQPIGVEAGFVGKFLGTVARNGCLCSLSYKDWRLLIGKKERNTNEEKNKKDILKQVKMRFLYPFRMEKWILRTIGERWRQHKSNLKSIYFDVHKSMEANCNNVPQGVIDDQWVALVNNWMTPKSQDISEANRINCTKKKSTHTAGTKSFARNREEWKEKDPEKKYPHRAVLYIQTHKTKSEKDMNAHVGDLKELMAQQPDLADTSQGKVAWRGDALNRVLGEEKPGHIHGLGLVPNPNQVFDLSTSKRLKNINMTSLDDKSSEDVVSLRLQMEKFSRHVQNQDATILELQQKTKILEQRHIQEECLDDPLHTLKDGFSADVTNSKRKRVYTDPGSEEFSMVDQSNCIMREKTTYVEQPRYKYYSTEDKSKEPNAHHEKIVQANKISAPHKAKSNQNDIRVDKNKYTTAKVVDHEISSNCSNHEVSYFQNKKMSTGASAAVLANKYQHGTKNYSPAANSLKIGTKVFLKSMKNQSKDVAFATVVSCDPTQKIEGVQLGREFFMVRVGITLEDDEPLVRPYKNYKVIGDVHGASIAWPSTFIEKINA